MLASFAAFTDQEYNDIDAKDSRNHWDALTGKDLNGRDGLVQEAIQKVLTYVRNDGYKYISAHDGPEIVPWGTGIETGFSTEEQLYDLNSDPGETVNIASGKPEILEKLKSLLDDEVKR
jgi:hypothetical protein